MKNKAILPLRPTLACAALLTTSFLLGCDAKPVHVPTPTAVQIQALATKTKAQLVLVQGGEFQMGDFGEIHSADKLPYTSEPYDGPLHKVMLSDFSISKYKVTLSDYDIYALANGLPLPYQAPDVVADDPTLRAHPQSPLFPVGVNWQDALGYCHWIGKQIGQAMDLPTESEWEYAARARGRFLVYATDNGEANLGRNFPSYDQVVKIRGSGSGDLPVGKYPPNSLGLFDMGINGFEWTNDWYAEDYYARSPAKDPHGPDSGTKKVVRGIDNGVDLPAKTFERSAREQELVNSKKNATNAGYGFRCVTRQK
ncbi:formylglycine-generating enzyme family protein [Massilia sp. TSP1-1-2]|uniref:formylglycine-generating enzyme family protein n=1 Tax=Massilia sp. TSP1-1-2 TaxID=2804649 RepID=UPI003CF7B2B5